MHINEAATLLKFSREEVKTAIRDGIMLPKSREIVKLKVEVINDDFDIDDVSLDEFITKFHEEEPGRHPPTAVRRTLLVEALHRCAICREYNPFEFHHIIEWHKIKHYDERHMLAICPNCHTKCTKGEIDQKMQEMYKRKLHTERTRDQGSTFHKVVGPTSFSWDDLREIIIGLHDIIRYSSPTSESKHDLVFVDLEEKNRINNMSHDYSRTVIEDYEPYFSRVDAFLKNPVNVQVAELYYEVVDELRSKISANRDSYVKFELFLLDFAQVTKELTQRDVRISGRTLNILLSFMYVNCDIGRKR